MKPTPTKAEIRERLQQEMDDFLKQGGAVNEVPRGISGREPGPPPRSAERSEGGADKPREERVYLTDVVAAIEARRRPAKVPAGRKRPRKRMIYDDFGEPLRWEWVEE